MRALAVQMGAPGFGSLALTKSWVYLGTLGVEEEEAGLLVSQAI